jgi:hypothetical protein
LPGPRNRIRLQLKGRKNQHVHPAAWNFLRLTPKICWYYHLPFHRVTTTAAQIAAPVPEIMDIAFYYYYYY